MGILRVFFCVSLLSLFSNASMAALPPLEQEERESDASHIVEGTVVEVSEWVQYLASGSVIHHKEAALKISQSLKGDLAVGEVARVHYQRIQLPEGFTGNIGQNTLPNVGDTIHVYARNCRIPNCLIALEPNGIEKK